MAAQETQLSLSITEKPTPPMHMACNLNCIVETKGLLNVTSSHLRFVDYSQGDC